MNDDQEIIVNEPTGHEFAVGEIEQSNRIMKSVTPYGTLDWYLKWVGSIIVLFAVAIRSAGIPELQIWDVFLSWVGAALWALVGFLWKDRAVLLLNTVLAMMLFSALLRELFV